MLARKWLLYFYLAAVLIIIGLLLHNPAQQTKPTQTLRMALVWVPNPQFAGFFLAQKLGFYKERGLEVEFLPYQTEESVHQLLVSEQADLGIDTPDQVLMARDQGDPLVALAAIFRISPVVFASHASLGVQHTRDLQDLRVGLLPDGTATLMDAILLHNGLSLNVIERVPMRYDMQGFLDGSLDVIPTYITDEPFLLDQKQVEYNLLLPHNHGMDTYGDTLMATESFVDNNQQAVADFVQASLKGWRYLLEQPEASRELLHEFMHPLYENPEHQAFILKQSVPLIHSGLGPLGWMDASHWQRLHDALQRQGLVEKPIDVRQIFTNQYLDMNN